MTLPWCLYWQLWTCFTLCSSVSVIELGHTFDFELGHAFGNASLDEYNTAQSYELSNQQTALLLKFLRGIFNFPYLKKNYAVNALVNLSWNGVG